MDNFNNETIDTYFFKIENANYNNACFYESFSNCIMKNINKKEMSNVIQKIAYDWIIKNENTYIEEFNMYVYELLKLSHNMNIKEYILS